MFSYEFCEIFKNSIFIEYDWQPLLCGYDARHWEIRKLLDFPTVNTLIYLFPLHSFSTHHPRKHQKTVRWVKKGW